MLLIFLLFGVTFFLLQDTLAKYRKKVDENVDISLASWNIKLNGESVAGKSSITGNITPIFDESEHVASGVLSPGIKGYFDIDIDASDVDVSFTYHLSVLASDVESYPDIIAYGYTLDPDNNGDVIDYAEDGIDGSIVHNTASTKIRVYIMWDDSDSNSMDNAQDTALAIANENITMKATFNFEQIKE